MSNVFIFHGSYGSATENWIPWLKTELEKFGVEVFAPNFPTPEGQSLESWQKVLVNKGLQHLANQSLVAENSILVAHSIATAFALSLLEARKAKALFSVAGFVSRLGDPEFDAINKTFLEREFAWNKIKANCQNFYVFHSDNDPYVDLSKAEELANKLDTKLILVKNAGHFNEAAGYTKFDLLLEKIKQELS